MSNQIELTQEQYNLWNEETGKVYQGEPMLSWDACAMIAWNKIAKRIENENLNRKVSQEG